MGLAVGMAVAFFFFFFLSGDGFVTDVRGGGGGDFWWPWVMFMGVVMGRARNFGLGGQVVLLIY